MLGDIVADQLLLPAYGSLQFLIDYREIDADGGEGVIAAVNLLRGAALCENAGPWTRNALLLSLHAPDGVAHTFVKSFGRSRPDVGQCLITLAHDIVDSSLIHLSLGESRDLVRNAIAIIKLYCEVLSQYVNKSSHDERCDGVKDIIGLLSIILTESSDFNVGEACYVGL